MRVLFVSPHAGLWGHAFPEALVADALARRGHDVEVVRCGGLFRDHCIVMNAARVRHESSDDDKRAVCRTCTRDAASLDTVFRFRTHTERDLVTSDDEAAVDALLQTTADDALVDVVVDGIPVGRVATYELLLEHKAASVNALGARERLQQRAHLRQALLALRAANRVLDDARGRPAFDRVIATNTLYSANAVWRCAAEKRGIVVYSLEAGPNLARRATTMAMSRSNNYDGLRANIAAWPSVRDVPCAQDEIEAVADHFVALIEGTTSFSYSTGTRESASSIKERFGFRADQKLVVAATSSPDEMAAAQLALPGLERPRLCFQTQHEWITALVDLLGGRSDVGLLVRVHPREFPTKRDVARAPSESATKLAEVLAHLPDNVKVNWPTDGVSLYDIAVETDVMLTAWSSVGKEAALLGVPALTYAASWAWYACDDLIESVDDAAAYGAALERCLHAPYDLERVRRAFRWYAFEGGRAVFSFADSYPQGAHETRGVIERAARRGLRVVAPRADRAIDLALRRPLAQGDAIARLVEEGAATRAHASDFLASLPVTTRAHETVALRRALARIARALGGDHPRAGTLPARIRDALS